MNMSSRNKVLLRLLYLLLLLFSADIRVADSIKCYCDQSHYLPPVECMLFDNTCTSTIGCYMRRWYSHEHDMILQRWNCISDEHDVSDQINYKDLFCGGWDTSDNAYRCCDNEDLCNRYLNITLEIERSTSPPLPSTTVYNTSIISYSTETPHSSHDNKNSHDKKNSHVGLIVAITVPIALTLLILASLLLTTLYLIQKRHYSPSQATTHHNLSTNPTDKHWTNSLELFELSCSSAGEVGIASSTATLPYQVLTDIQDIVKLNYQIGIGRYGVFYHGFYEGIDIVLKRFDEDNRSAWLRESLMYSCVLQTHENILTFYSSAMTKNNAEENCTTGLWLVTKYHEFGSLQDYLRHRTVDAKMVLQMSASICSGLAHLHSESSGNQTKLPVAHCNLTSRNILVKENLSCCIGDFRLAVFKHKNEVYRPEEGADTGTVRYMSPEMLLSETMNVLSLETFKQTDVYALGLILWEICQRGGSNRDAYQVPFQGLVPPEPSLEDMHRLIVTERAQPTVPNKWNNTKLLREMTKVMRECWYYTSTARPTAVYLKKKLLKMSQELENMDNVTQETAATAPSKDDDSQAKNCGNVYVLSL